MLLNSYITLFVDVFGALESVKAAADVYAPVAGEVSEVNSKLESEPELVNKDPFGDGRYIYVVILRFWIHNVFLLFCAVFSN